MSTELPRDNSVSYVCGVCAGDQDFNPTEFREHLRTTHYVTEMRGEMKMTLHLDSATHFMSSYEGEVQGIKCYKHTRNERETAYRLRCMKAKKSEFEKLPPLSP